jgi:hypothetical protein
MSDLYEKSLQIFLSDFKKLKVVDSNIESILQKALMSAKQATAEKIITNFIDGGTLARLSNQQFVIVRLVRIVDEEATATECLEAID